MKKFKRLVLVFVVLTALFVGSYHYIIFREHNYSPDFLQIDACLDHGGCWDRTDRTCRRDEPDAQALCRRMKRRAP